jgi:hypothetical protein
VRLEAAELVRLRGLVRSIRLLGAEQEAVEEWPVVRDDPVPELNGPDEWAASGETNRPRMPVDFLQDEENRSASREPATIGGDNLHGLAGLLAQRWGHGWARTLLKGDDLESLLAVMPPEPGGSSPSKVSPSIPDEHVSSHRECALHRPGSVPPMSFSLLGIGVMTARHP